MSISQESIAPPIQRGRNSSGFYSYRTPLSAIEPAFTAGIIIGAFTLLAYAAIYIGQNVNNLAQLISQRGSP